LVQELGGETGAELCIKRTQKQQAHKPPKKNKVGGRDIPLLMALLPGGGRTKGRGVMPRFSLKGGRTVSKALRNTLPRLRVFVPVIPARDLWNCSKKEDTVCIGTIVPLDTSVDSHRLVFPLCLQEYQGGKGKEGRDSMNPW